VAIRFGFVVGILLPLALLAINVIFGYGGILATVALFVWIGTGILLTPTPEEEH